jgi:hypothetical protein
MEGLLVLNLGKYKLFKIEGTGPDGKKKYYTFWYGPEDHAAELARAKEIAEREFEEANAIRKSLKEQRAFFKKNERTKSSWRGKLVNEKTCLVIPRDDLGVPEKK